MIQVTIGKNSGQYRSFCVSGHAGYAEAGADIVCAGVTSAVQLTVNGICEVLKEQIHASLVVEENRISLSLAKTASPVSRTFVEALALHLTLLAEDYPDCITLLESESNLDNEALR